MAANRCSSSVLSASRWHHLMLCQRQIGSSDINGHWKIETALSENAQSPAGEAGLLATEAAGGCLGPPQLISRGSIKKGSVQLFGLARLTPATLFTICSHPKGRKAQASKRTIACCISYRSGSIQKCAGTALMARKAATIRVSRVRRAAIVFHYNLRVSARGHLGARAAIADHCSLQWRTATDGPGSFGLKTYAEACGASGTASSGASLGAPQPLDVTGWAARLRGRRTMNSDPSPSRLATEISPPCRSIIILTR